MKHLWEFFVLVSQLFYKIKIISKQKVPPKFIKFIGVGKNEVYQDGPHKPVWLAQSIYVDKARY